MRKLSFCFTNYNRVDFLLEAIKPLVEDRWVDEIIVSDDCSDIEIYNEVKEKLSLYSKVKIYRNESNLGVYYNKRKSVELATNEYVVVADSDNLYDNLFVTKLFQQTWNPLIILAPDFAAPVFSYKHFAGLYITKENAWQYTDVKAYDCLLNTMNYFVNREKYLEVFEDGIEPIGSDSITQNYNWIKNGGCIYVVPDLEYQHRVHSDSHYVHHATESTPLCQQVMQKIRELKPQNTDKEPILMTF